MIIGVDGNEANVEKRVGVGKYAFELLKQFYNFQFSIFNFQSNPNFQFQIYLKEKPLADLPKETDWWQYKVVGPKKFWTQIGLPLALYKDSPYRSYRRRRINVFFSPTHYAPRFCPCPRVISIMDLSFLHFPEMFKKEDLWQLKNWTEYSVRKAAKILTISKASKRDIIKYYQVPEERVAVTYPGFDGEAVGSKYQVASMRNIKEKYGIEGDYILSVGTLQPRKNFTRLIQALNILMSQYPNISLVIVGKPGWLYQEIYEAPKKFGVEERVKFLDYVPDKDLPALYKNAKCLVLVSLYEGFGLPALEALSLGCPVVVSNVSSLPEVAGEVGILVDPNDIQNIAKGIEKMLKMDDTERKRMIQRGLEQAKKFSWEKCAKETLDVLKEVVKTELK